MKKIDVRTKIALSVLESILKAKGGTSKGWIESTVKEAFKCADEILKYND